MQVRQGRALAVFALRLVTGGGVYLDPVLVRYALERGWLRRL